MEAIILNEITSLTPSKTNIQIVSKEMTEPILRGDVDPIEFAVRCQFAIDTLTECLKIAKENTKLEKETTMLGAKVEVAETGTKYDYSANDTWNEIEAKLTPLLAEKKALEDKIKMATKIGNNLVDDDGTIIASPVAKSSTTSIKITLAK